MLGRQPLMDHRRPQRDIFRSHASITPANGAIACGRQPFRDGPFGGTEVAPSSMYFFTVRQSQPALAAISA